MDRNLKCASWASLVHTARAPAAVIGGVGLALALLPQTRDIISGLWEGKQFWHGDAVTFHVLLAALGFSAWHWSRAALSARFLVGDTRQQRSLIRSAVDADGPVAMVLLPRLLFSGAFVVACIATWRSRGTAPDGGWWWTVPSYAAILGIWIGGLVLLVWRLPLQKRMTGREDQTAAARDPAWLRSAPLGLGILLRHAPFGPVFGTVLMTLAMICFALGTLGTLIPVHGSRVVLPVALGRVFPGPDAAMLVLAVMLAPLTALTFAVESLRASRRIWGLKIEARWTPALLLLATTMTVVPKYVHLHQVRIVTTSAAMAPAHRLELAKLLKAWGEACPGAGPLRPVIVAISGGASRAGLWGARVLRDVDTAARAGGTGIFAISSVSGGSLGAAGYMIWRAGQPDANACGTVNPPAAAPEFELVAAMRGDALGPLLAGALFGDVPRAMAGLFLWPGKLFGQPGLPRGGDRAAAMERAFEANWRAAFAAKSIPGRSGVPGLEQPYLALAYAGNSAHLGLGSVPIWIANGTDQQNGERLLTVPFLATRPISAGAGAAAGWPFDGAKDVLALVGADMPISAVIDNTARFPFLSPVGELTPGGAVRSDQTRPAQIVDGGYFDNEGMQTASELAAWLEPQKLVDGRPITPILVQATSDADEIPANVDPHLPRCTGPFQDDPGTPAGKPANDQISAPIAGIIGVRAGHSGVVLRQVLDRYCGPPQRFFHFYLYDKASGQHAIPLNWSLSRPVADYIWNDIKDEPANASELQRLSKALAPLALGPSVQLKETRHTGE